MRGALDKRVAAVFEHGRYILGPEVAELEEALAEYVGVKHCVGVASGTDSLLIALMALKVGPGASFTYGTGNSSATVTKAASDVAATRATRARGPIP